MPLMANLDITQGKEEKTLEKRSHVCIRVQQRVQLSVCVEYHLEGLAKGDTYALSIHPSTFAAQTSPSRQWELNGQSGLRTFVCVFIDGEEGEVSHPEEIQLLRIKIQVP